jgi:hypothetical protein
MRQIAQETITIQALLGRYLKDLFSKKATNIQEELERKDWKSNY